MSKRATILVVDDDEINRLVASKYLRSIDLDVIVAKNGVEAIDIVKTKVIDLVLMDLEMPIKDGLAATKDIRAMIGDYFRDLPIIALTAATRRDLQKAIFQSGMNDYLVKPFDPSQLSMIIAGMLH